VDGSSNTPGPPHASAPISPNQCPRCKRRSRKSTHAPTHCQTRLKAWLRVLSANKPKAIQGRNRGRVHGHAQFSATW